MPWVPPVAGSELNRRARRAQRYITRVDRASTEPSTGYQSAPSPLSHLAYCPGQLVEDASTSHFIDTAVAQSGVRVPRTFLCGSSTGGSTVRTKAAALFEQPGKWEVVELELEAPRQDELMIRMVAAGLCHSDDHIL